MDRESSSELLVDLLLSCTIKGHRQEQYSRVRKCLFVVRGR